MASESLSSSKSQSQGSESERLSTSFIPFVVLFILLAFVILRNAWVCDDAYISFRTVDNFVNGYGLTWNSAERVQAFTHPLWVMVVSFFYSLTWEFYYTSLFLSLLLTITAVYVITRHVSSGLIGAGFAVSLLIFSKAFIDYATSGLENALSYALIASFGAVVLTGQTSTRRLFWVSLLCAMLALNRLDLVLFTVPTLIWYFMKTPRGGRMAVVVIGFLPLMLWELFSLIYYGFLVPNTYFAKVHTGIPKVQMMKQGFAYFLDTLNIDPLTLMIITAAVTVGLVWPRRFTRPLSIGLLLYMIYVVWVGGDFMSGRFFSVPFLLAVVVLTRYTFPSSPTLRIAPFVIVVLIGFLSPRSPMASGSSYGTTGEGGINARGIADERAYYYQSTGLLTRNRSEFALSHRWLSAGQALRRQGREVSYQRTVGFVGFGAGPDVHIVDGYALAEPLLARLPVTQRYRWRIGHFLRPMPAGYMKSLSSNTNVITDSCLSAYYEKLLLIIRGPVFDWNRLATIWHMNTGTYDDLLDCYTKTPMVYLTYNEASIVKKENTKWNAEGNFVIRYSGLRVALDSISYCKHLEVSVDHNDYYYVVFRNLQSEVDWIAISPDPRSGLRVDTVDVPYEVHLGGYDAIDIIPYDGDDMYSVGHIQLLE